MATNNIFNDLTYLSKYAQQLFNTNPTFKNEVIVEIYEHLSHDGYDQHGPESDIWDLYVVTLADGSPDTYIYYTFSAENWFYPDANVEYELTESYASPVLYLLKYVEGVDYKDYRCRIDFVKQLEIVDRS